jgi:hypothetical protein
MTQTPTIADADRALMSATLRRLAEELDGAELSTALEEFGFADLLAAEPRAAVSSLFDALGRAGSMCSAFQDVLLFPLTGTLADQTADHSVVLPRIGAQHAGVRDGQTLSVRGLVIGQRPANAYLLPAVADGQTVWVRLPATDDLGIRPVAGLDPALAMTEIHGDGLRAQIVSAGEAAASTWDMVATAGRRALGYQIVGAVGQMIDLAVTHARDRLQFGRPVGSFQAVRNRLADAHVARQGATAALALSWYADEGVLAGMLAKSLAGRAARIAATQCQQVLAGIGFTAEHPFHRFLARALVLDSVLGSAAELPRAIGARLIAVGTIPRLVEL